MTSSARSSLIAIARVRNVASSLAGVLLDDPVDGLGLDAGLLGVVDAAGQVAVGVGDRRRGEQSGDERHQGDLREWGGLARRVVGPIDGPCRKVSGRPMGLSNTGWDTNRGRAYHRRVNSGDTGLGGRIVLVPLSSAR